MTLGEFVTQYRNQHGLSQRQFANICGLSNGYISMIEKNLNPKTQQPLVPSIPVLKKIASAMSITLNDLFRQVDDMPVNIDWTNEIDAAQNVGTPLPDNIIPLPKTYKIPLVGKITCGEPITAQENIEDMISIPESIHADFALRCKGNSMVGARILNGDVVYIHQQPEVENGQIAAVLIDGEATLKRVYVYPDKLVLIPENPAYAPMVYAGSELEEVRIIGRAVAFTSGVK